MSHALRADLDPLRRLLPRQVHGPGDSEWERMRLPWAVNVAQDPAAVVVVDAATEVSTAVRYARERGGSVSVQPVGHSATAHLDGTILLRTANLAEIAVDPERRIARVGAGVKWQALLAECGKHALVPLSGSSGDPSVVGLAVGGGLSWFSRAHGSTADSIVAVELVDADGQFRRITAASDPELFWAVRGGGDFGIVTALELRLFPAQRLWGGRLLWPIAHAREVLQAFVQVTDTAPDEFTAWAHLLRFPPLPEVPEPLRGGAFVSVDATCLGTRVDPEPLLAPLRALPAPLLDTTGDVEIAELGAILAEPTDPMPDLHISELLTDLDAAALDALLHLAGPDARSSLMIVQLRHLGGALARVAREPGATGTIGERFALMALGVPVSAATGAAIQADLAALQAALAPYLSGRVPFTFLSATDTTERAFEPATLSRLREIKKARDPHGVIRSNHPVLATT